MKRTFITICAAALLCVLFSACGTLKSASTEYKSPITNLRWKNADGKSIKKALVDDEVYLCADVTEEIAEGSVVKIRIIEKDETKQDAEVATFPTTVKNGKIACAWKITHTDENEDEDDSYIVPAYVFTAECDGLMSGESPQLDVFSWIRTQLLDKGTGKPIANKKYTIYLLDGTEITGTTDDEGYVVQTNLKKGQYFIVIRE